MKTTKTTKATTKATIATTTPNTHTPKAWEPVMPTPRAIVAPTAVQGKPILLDKGFTVTTAKDEPRKFKTYEAATAYARTVNGRVTFWVEPDPAE